MCVSGCETISSDAAPRTCSIPAWPIAGAPVADEMDRVCPTVNPETGEAQNPCPAINDWHGRLSRYKQQLEANP